MSRRAHPWSSCPLNDSATAVLVQGNSSLMIVIRSMATGFHSAHLNNECPFLKKKKLVSLSGQRSSTGTNTVPDI